MDHQTFDRVARLCSTGAERRTVLGLLLGGALGAAGRAEGEAKKKKPCPPCKKRKKGKCKGTLPEGTGCTDTAGRGGTCQSGSCVAAVSPPPPAPVGCPAGQKPCGGGCIPSNQCCTNGDCAANAPRCCQGTCLRTTECCTSADCGSGTICQSGECVCAPGNPPCGDICCTAPPGFSPESIECVSGGGGSESCSCTYRAANVCGPGCPSQQRFNFDCEVPNADELAILCQEAGCDPPPG